ncbi:hypothetical protein AUC71_15030 [Methyloceanibacter marginalis]|uniref:DUF7146 domain-containing protein n=1 Tax=Methyloceanibacter marginalis TaxID=1774971 RepID=A0A1E3WBP0_9HYPH|nr:hypothetical protein [Methyloceanibacter marginalis]ODS02497.1 hypothetical protein AUC71_15030 [Methyloceanibacter marginalis]
MNAADIARALGGRRVGEAGWWECRCPVHDDRHPSLNLKDAMHGGREVVSIKCHAGCPRDEIVEALRSMGLWRGRGRPSNTEWRKPEAPKAPDEPRYYRAAMRTWRSSRPAGGTIAETYLRSRGISLSVPGALRFAPSLRHRDTNGSGPRAGGAW